MPGDLGLARCEGEKSHDESLYLGDQVRALCILVLVQVLGNRVDELQLLLVSLFGI